MAKVRFPTRSQPIPAIAIRPQDQPAAERRRRRQIEQIEQNRLRQVHGLLRRTVGPFLHGFDLQSIVRRRVFPPHGARAESALGGEETGPRRVMEIDA